MDKITIDTEFIKLDSLLKFCGWVDSGAIAKLLIKDGLVKVNGEVEYRRGKKIYPGDQIEYDNEKVIVDKS
ncbi:MAG: RNA-binding S4 domain-containing protein [Tissierellia bacterium]|nr:RNA-binding S4 domain-containing protein [Tissierellia bacterium]